MAPTNLFTAPNTRARKPFSAIPEMFKYRTPPSSCSCTKELAREKVHLRFFLRQLIQQVGIEALDDMFKGFRIPVPTIHTLFEAEAQTYLVSKGEDLPKDAQGKPKRTVAPTDFILVKDEPVENERKKLKKVKKEDEPKERIFIDLTLDD